MFARISDLLPARLLCYERCRRENLPLLPVTLERQRVITPEQDGGTGDF
jgi:hypothetical protein